MKPNTVVKVSPKAFGTKPFAGSPDRVIPTYTKPTAIERIGTPVKVRMFYLSDRFLVVEATDPKATDFPKQLLLLAPSGDTFWVDSSLFERAK